VTNNWKRAVVRLAQAAGAGLGVAAMAIAASSGVAAADPNTGSDVNPIINDYLSRVSGLVDQFTGENTANPIGADQFNALLNAESARLIDAVIDAKLPR
jgi:hypothetical protein